MDVNDWLSGLLSIVRADGSCTRSSKSSSNGANGIACAHQVLSHAYCESWTFERDEERELFGTVVWPIC